MAKISRKRETNSPSASTTTIPVVLPQQRTHRPSNNVVTFIQYSIIGVVIALVHRLLSTTNWREWSNVVASTTFLAGSKSASKESLVVPSSHVKTPKPKNSTGKRLVCRFVMAESTIPGNRFGIYAVRDVPKQSPVLYGEPVIQLFNIGRNISKEDIKDAPGLRFLLERYYAARNDILATATGGGHNDETDMVTSVIGGIALLANEHSDQFNVEPIYRLTTGHHGISRFTSVMAGANTHHQSRGYTSRRLIQAGEEILVAHHGNKQTNMLKDLSNVTLSRPISWLHEHGMCVDNLESVISKGRGLGAQSTRFLPKGSVIAPVPVIPISRDSLQFKTPGGKVPQIQLLLNYCYGHTDSPILLFPYGPSLTLINHNMEHPNAELRWSPSVSELVRSLNATQILAAHQSVWLLELVALQDIHPREEVFISYGADWHAAYQKHVEKHQWDDSILRGYVYPWEYNASTVVLPTIDEEASGTYFHKPWNLEFGCYYAHHAAEIDEERGPTKWRFPEQWMGNTAHLHPCRILTRDNGNNEYTVELQTSRHKVVTVPRPAIYPMDRPYTSDFILPSSFRHAIGLPDHVFPSLWLTKYA